MAAVVTDQFRVLNANNFVDSVLDQNNSYYVFLGLANPTDVGFGRTTTWNNENDVEKNPVDNLDYLNHYKETMFFGKKITSSNVRRVVKKVSWTSKIYDMYRHDYSSKNLAPNSQLPRLYDSEFYVVNSDFKVYICIDNQSSISQPNGKESLVEPTFTDLEPTTLSDGYVWKYLFSISPSDIIKFDSTEYIILPNDWSTSTDPQIQNVRETGNSDVNLNQIKKVYIDNKGAGYANSKSEVCNIIGDGSGAKVLVNTDATGSIISTKVTAGGSGYTYGYVDLNPVRKNDGTNPSISAKLIIIIPPSKGHGFDIYKELGADRVLVYARFDDSTRDFPTNSKFAQIGILKNPEQFGGTSLFTENQFSSLYSLKVTTNNTTLPTIGEKIEGSSTGTVGYVASYDSDTQVLKYYVDRSLSFYNKVDSTDSTSNKKLSLFTKDDTISTPAGGSGFSAGISTFSGSIFSGINLGVTFEDGTADPEINRKSGDVIYIDNRTLVTRNSRQKEDVKIILEF